LPRNTSSIQMLSNDQLWPWKMQDWQCGDP
jgi:hypothetical protein